MHAVPTGLIVAALILIALAEWWLASAMAIAAYVFFGVRYLKRVRGKSMSGRDWALGLAIWWVSALSDWIKRWRA